ncbi:uncharacterized protein LOC124870209 isoform X4 [Girardinichthys multiradiatus]|uniref:uncharacterized protein LOC124870209 isoform X4 n=1 Tax=Girardinichthys multiradiatus TaxID=208333 RepID=UPI001FAE4454|nr:uncharacterized protein LOC124870209 isoform X4 [Girardinichthys multiradiatus]
MTGHRCCIYGCPSRSHGKTGAKLNNGVRFFCFPKWKKHQEEPVAEVTRRHRMAWVAAVGRRDITFDRILPSKRVCSLHFHSGKPAYEMLESHPDWKPSLLLGHSQVRQEEEQQVTPHTVEVVLKYEEDEEEEEKQEETGLPQPVEDNMLDQCALEQITCLKETAIAAFEDTVAALYARMSSLVHWPDRERVWVSMPRLFVETFGGQLTVVVDCFEVSAKTLSNIESWDQHSRTVKYVTGITPQGVISFISRGRSGCSSDIEVTESCGLLDKLLLGDIVLAGRGFNVEESVSMMCAEVKASSPDGCRELDLKTTEETRQLAHLRDHVKRIIGAVCNTFKILSSNVPVRMVEPCEGESVTFLDKVVTVCCALINLCPHGVLSLQKSK